MKIGSIEREWAAEALEPAVGWKIWRVDHSKGQTRLRSVLYGDLWPARRPLSAVCRRVLRSVHEAPCRACGCGIHAGRELAAWEHYLSIGAEERVFGRALLWGSTIEGSAGWRAAQASPVEIFVPATVERAEDVADGLRAYGVPVHLVEDPAAAPVEEVCLR